ncbi:hypothetical protein FA95DRAFT_1607067 [Auriscalpium vulgare]|uniref:Uncharacterized protein n=1 Tax=Auriscalpium vulgare TaxID=40419 RepID=A0ACB8RRY5_9AGAM|nr:hypothetical protein FA95DRAFT_1607067 [Auriscalpium vulgare]
MKTLTAFALLAVFSASCTAAPLPTSDNFKQVRAGTSQPDLSARGPFNIGQLSHLNSLGAALVEPERENLAHAGAGTPDPELSARDPFNIGQLSHLNQISGSAVEPALRDLQSLSGGGSARHALAKLESRFRLPPTLQNNLRLKAHISRSRFAARSPSETDVLLGRTGDNVALRAGSPEPELSVRYPFNIGELFHLNQISASAVEPDRSDSLALRNIPSLSGGESADETTKHARVKRISGFHLPSTLEKNLLLGAGSAEFSNESGPTDNFENARAEPELSVRDPFNLGDLSHLNFISAEAVEPGQAQRRDGGLTLRELQSLSGAGLAGDSIRHALDKRASGFRLPFNLEKNLLRGAGNFLR